LPLGAFAYVVFLVPAFRGVRMADDLPLTGLVGKPIADLKLHRQDPRPLLGLPPRFVCGFVVALLSHRSNAPCLHATYCEREKA